jgi:peptidoglycan/LPS O-acetylase OafA/YrhL
VAGGTYDNEQQSGIVLLSYPKDIRSLTRLRFFAALWVVIFHWRANWDIPVDNYTGFFESGRLGVDIFFVLSGFVLAHAYFAKVREGKFDYWQFLVARIARIYPLHLLMFGFVGLMLVGSKYLGASADPTDFPPGHILPNLLLIQAWGLTPGATWNVPAWSISAEWFAYLLFPFFALIGMKFYKRPIIGFGIGLVLFFTFDQIYIRMTGSSLPSATDNFGILRIVPEFLMGFMLYLIGQKRQITSAVLRNGGLGLTIFMFILATHWQWDERFIALLSLPLIYLLAEVSRAGPGNAPAFDPLEYLGRVSYSIYLLHVPFFMAVYNLMEDVLGWADGPLSTLTLLALLVVFMPICMLSYHLIENPARDFVRKWGNHMIHTYRVAFSGASFNNNVKLAQANKRELKT